VDLHADRSERPLPALHVEMCMVQHLLLSALGVDRHERPLADFHQVTFCCGAASTERTSERLFSPPLEDAML
jgi:hypothetical protein